MADISKCLSTDCPSFHTCYRATVIGAYDGWQSYIYGKWTEKTGVCEYFMKDKNSKTTPVKTITIPEKQQSSQYSNTLAVMANLIVWN